jgi:hypothetical protein
MKNIEIDLTKINYGFDPTSKKNKNKNKILKIKKS